MTDKPLTEEEKAAKLAADKAAADKAAADKAAVAKREAYERRRERAEATFKELAWMDEELEAHGLTISDLLRTVAKHFNGVTIPRYVPDAKV